MIRLQRVLSVLSLLAIGSTAAPQPPQQESVTHLIADARAAMARIRDYTGTLVKQERINGQLQPEQFIDMRIRQQPFSVALKWTAPKQFVDQEAFFVLGKNNNEMKAKGTGLASFAGLVSMLPNDPRALKHSRHSITETGIGNLIETIARSNELERRLPASQMKVTFGDYAFQQRPCTRMDVTHLVNSGQFYCHRCIVYFDKEWKLPVRMEAYDWPSGGGNTGGDLIESYSYTNLKFNVGLNDAAFGY